MLEKTFEPTPYTDEEQQATFEEDVDEVEEGEEEKEERERQVGYLIMLCNVYREAFRVRASGLNIPSVYLVLVLAIVVVG